MSEFKPLEVDIGLCEDPFDDEDMGFFRGPIIFRKLKESYKGFQERVKGEAQKLVDEYNSIPSLRRKITELENKLMEMDYKMSCIEGGEINP